MGIDPRMHLNMRIKRVWTRFGRYYLRLGHGVGVQGKLTLSKAALNKFMHGHVDQFKELNGGKLSLHIHNIRLDEESAQQEEHTKAA